MPKQFEAELQEWIKKEKAAIELLNIVSNLWLDRSIELVIFRRKIIDMSVSTILNDHLNARDYVGKPINVEISLELARAVVEYSDSIPPTKIDLGKLASEWLDEQSNYSSTLDFLKNKLTLIVEQSYNLQPKDVVLYGFGRIGRLAARILIGEAGKGEQLRLRAIVTRSNSESDMLKRADLLRKDSVHGKMAGSVVEDIENKALLINGHRVHMIAANNPEDIDYTQYGINNAIVIDNTGVWRNREGLGKHLKAKGVDQVLLTAPGKDDIPNIVYGVNEAIADLKNEKIFSAASCTTNCVVPVLKIISDNLGIEKGHLESVHSYTNDQNLLDNFHKKYRRGKSAPLNMVITETGAAKAVAKTLPELTGKMTGNAVRVPTPNVSLAILNLDVSKAVTKEEVNKMLHDASYVGNLVEQIDFSTSNELVSTDVVGSPHAAIVDGPATIVSKDGKSLVLYVWYDNEYGYTRQTIRLAKYISGVIRLKYY